MSVRRNVLKSICKCKNGIFLMPEPHKYIHLFRFGKRFLGVFLQIVSASFLRLAWVMHLSWSWTKPGLAGLSVAFG